jgi:hypothetical protein
MRAGRALSGVERAVALCLAAVWIATGCAALYFALLQSRWLVSIAALGAVGFGIVWARVAWLGRLLK